MNWSFFTHHVHKANQIWYLGGPTICLQQLKTSWVGRVTVNGLEKFLSVSRCVCVSDPAVPQKLDTPGLPYLACIHSSEVVRMSTSKNFFTVLEAIKRARKLLGVASSVFQTAFNEARVLHHWLS